MAKLGRPDAVRPVDRRSALFSASVLPLSLAWLADAAGRGIRARAGGAEVGRAEIDVVRSITGAFNRADEIVGGGHGKQAVVQYLVTDVAAYCDSQFRNEQDRRDMFGAAAELAYLAGWKSHDIGQEGFAQGYYSRSLQLATESDPVGHAAWALRILAHQSLDLGQPRHCQELATKAWEMVRGRIAPAGEALFAITAARAHGANRDRRRAVRAIVRAEQALEVGDDRTPRWAAVTGPARATVASHTAKTFAALGDHVRAEAHYAAAAGRRDPGGYRRIHALTLTQLAEAQAAQGNADEACATWSVALDHMLGVSSDRHLKAIARMRNRMASFGRRGVPGVAELDRRGAQLQRAQRPRR